MQDSVKKSLLAIVIVASIAGIIGLSMSAKPKQKISKKDEIDVQMEKIDDEDAAETSYKLGEQQSGLVGESAQVQCESVQSKDFSNQDLVEKEVAFETNHTTEPENLIEAANQPEKHANSVKFNPDIDASASEIEPEKLVDDSSSTPSLPTITPVQKLLNAVTDVPIDSGVVLGSEMLVDAINHVTIPHENVQEEEEGKAEVIENDASARKEVDKPQQNGHIEPEDDIEAEVGGNDVPTPSVEDETAIELAEELQEENVVEMQNETVLEPVEELKDNTTIELVQELQDIVPVSDVEPVLSIDDAIPAPALQYDKSEPVEEAQEDLPAVNDLEFAHPEVEPTGPISTQNNGDGVVGIASAGQKEEPITIAPVQELLNAIAIGIKSNSGDIQELLHAVNQVGIPQESNEVDAVQVDIPTMEIDEVYEISTDGILNVSCISFADLGGEYHCLYAFMGEEEPLGKYFFSLWYTYDESGGQDEVVEEDVVDGDGDGDGTISKDTSTNNSTTNAKSKLSQPSQSQSNKKSRKSKKKKGGNLDGVEESDDTTLQDLTDDEVDIAKPVLNIQAIEFVPDTYPVVPSAFPINPSVYPVPVYTEFYPSYEEPGSNRKPKKSKRKFAKKTHTHDPTLADFVRVTRTRTKSSSRCLFGMTCANKECVYAHE